MNTVRQLKGLITEGKKLFAYDDNGAKVTWNAEDGGWEDVCGHCNKSWCEGGEYNDSNQWYCVDCYVSEDEESDCYVSEDEECGVCGNNLEKCFVRPLVVAKKEYWFDDNLWFIIKGFAGIYDFQIDWSRRWNNPKAYSRIMSQTNYTHSVMFGITTLKAYYALSEDVIRKRVFKLIEPAQKEQLYEKLETLYPLFSVPTWIKVGTEIQWSGKKIYGEFLYGEFLYEEFLYEAGKVTKITDKSISISVYECPRVRVIDPTGQMCYTCRKWNTKIAKKVTHSTLKRYSPKEEFWGKSSVTPYDDNTKAIERIQPIERIQLNYLVDR